MATGGCSRLVTVLLISLLVLSSLLVFTLAAGGIHSFDPFWQLQSGRYMAASRQFIFTDLFTLAPDAPRFEHCWLHDLVLYGCYQVAGYAGLSLLKGGLLTLTALLLMATARLRDASWGTILLVLPVYLFTFGYWTCRPQLWTFLGFGLSLFLLERHLARGDRQVFWLLPTAALWVNLHAGSILLLALLFAYAVGSLPRFWRKRMEGGQFVPLSILALLGLCTLVPLLSPYPGRWFGTLFSSAKLGTSRSETGEVVGVMTAVFNMDWTPTSFQSSPWFFYGLAAVALFLLLGWRRLRLTDLCLFAGLALMGLKLDRHTPFFMFAMLALLPAYVDSAFRPLVTRYAGAGSYLQIAMACLGFIFFLYLGIDHYRLNWTPPGLRAWHYPVAATEFVEQNNLPGPLYNTYDWGGYLAWRLYPDYKVFWDGRQNSPEMFRLGWNVMVGRPGWQESLDRFAVKTIVTRCLTMDKGQRYPLLDRLEKSPDWALVFAGEASLVFVRRDAMSATWLQEHERAKADIWQTLRSEAKLSVAENPMRYAAWWELAKLDLEDRQFDAAFESLGNFLSRTPQPAPLAERYYRMLYPMMQKKGTADGE